MNQSRDQRKRAFIIVTFTLQLQRKLSAFYSHQNQTTITDLRSDLSESVQSQTQSQKYERHLGLALGIFVAPFEVVTHIWFYRIGQQ